MRISPRAQSTAPAFRPRGRSARTLLTVAATVALIAGLLPATAATAATSPPTPEATPTAVPEPTETPGGEGADAEPQPTSTPAATPSATPTPSASPAPAPEVNSPAEDAAPPVAKVSMQRDQAPAEAPGLAEKDLGGDETLDVADPGGAPYPEAGTSGSVDGAAGARLKLVRPKGAIVQAAPVVGFVAGDIISDSVFGNRASMSEKGIRSFIDSKVATCQSGYTCLEMYRETTPTRAADAYCSRYAGGANEDAARIIYKVAQACGVNPQVLLVMLQKEQGLVTHVWPSTFRYTIAMGMGCPDTAACDKLYYGFFNQVYGAARQMQIYGKSSYFTWYAPGGTRSIRYHPNTSCGSSGVYVQNKATAGLYYYTPYQPNAASLAAGTGTGDSCSSYGNRNFYNYFTVWFGSPRTLATSRIYGADRFETSARISEKYSAGVSVAYVASGEGFADALSAAPAAAKAGGPLLLVEPNRLPQSVRDALIRLKPKRIVVVGGTGAVNAGVYALLAKIQPNIRRDAGADRYATSRIVNQRAFGAGAPVAYVATGQDFPDALSASAAAGAAGAPVVLVDGTRSAADSATAKLIGALKPKEIRIAGGPGAVSSGIQAQFAKLAPVKRLAGDDRYDTSTAVNRGIYSKAPAVVFATGVDYADALAGAAFAGRVKRPLVLADSNCISSSASSALVTWGTGSQLLLGGPAVLGRGVVDHAVCR
ncbi:cell wall-binding repeat-containing protein [Microbacterium phosphatis]|uniref:cell wall-binding repeat-containing protein n=1 Tax=Microbacterium phosphatis TaxID=3140248 RepID=UPI003140C018